MQRTTHHLAMLLSAGIILLGGCSASRALTGGDTVGAGWTVRPAGNADNARADASENPRNSHTPEDDSAGQVLNGVSPTDAGSVEAVGLESVLRREISEWSGTPYILGGTSRSGIDCSGLIQRIYGDVFNYRLPRTTKQQIRTGQRVSSIHLQAGDLLFFRPGGTGSHAGIYLADGDFAHASSSRGVMISNLDEGYWDRAFVEARRLLISDSDVSTAVAYANRMAGIRREITGPVSRR